MPEAPAEEATRAADQVAGSETLGRVARAGMVARGIVYLVIAVLAARLAIGERGTDADQQEALRPINDPKKAVGLDGALHELASSSYGPLVPWVVAGGLAGFGLYSIADARYRRV
jgi:hypothetical protein